VFLEAARKRSNDPRFGFQHPDARALPLADGSFDRAFSMLVLSFITDIEHAVAEMRRVVRPGRTGDCSKYGTSSAECRFFGCCGTPQPRSLEPPNGRTPCSRR
jgi:ubiquinone/menaquinone biosynthesis C-methylase UbiE